MVRLAFFLLSLLATTSFAKSDVSPILLDDGLVSVDFDEQQPITFVGKKSTNTSIGVGNGVMYPADTAGVFFVSILTHAAVSGSVEKSRLSKEQQLANKVLDPYAEYIDDIDANYLLDENQLNKLQAPNLAFLRKGVAEDRSRWYLTTKLIYAMTQSQKSFIVYNRMKFTDRSLLNNKKKGKLHSKKTKKNTIDPNEKLVVIVSDPIDVENVSDFWLSNDAERFRVSIKDLYVESFNLGVMRQFGSMSSSQEKQVTIKYLEDGLKKIERGYLINQTCKRTVFESLANEIKSVPNLDYFSCQDS